MLKPKANSQELKSSLPGRLHNPGYLTLQRQAAEAQTAEAKLAQESARPSTDRAAVAVLGGELRFLVRLGDLCCSCHLCPSDKQSAFSNQHSARTSLLSNPDCLFRLPPDSKPKLASQLIHSAFRLNAEC
jgi:hypothetical protein